jgi:hypothetical protein
LRKAVCNVAAHSRVNRRRGIGRARKERHHRGRLLWGAEAEPQHAAEGPRDSLCGIVDAFVGDRDFVFQARAHVRGQLARERILIREMVVESAFGDIRAHRNFVHAQRIHTSRGEQSMSCVQEGLAGGELPPVTAIGTLRGVSLRVRIWSTLLIGPPVTISSIIRRFSHI